MACMLKDQRHGGLAAGFGLVDGKFEGEGGALPGPSLCAVSEPPISVAASAALCRPKPWPSLFVVKPWAKMRARFSGGDADAVVRDDDLHAVVAVAAPMRTVIRFCRARAFAHRILGVANAR